MTSINVAGKLRHLCQQPPVRFGAVSTPLKYLRVNKPSRISKEGNPLGQHPSSRRVSFGACVASASSEDDFNDWYHGEDRDTSPLDAVFTANDAGSPPQVSDFFSETGGTNHDEVPVVNGFDPQTGDAPQVNGKHVQASVSAGEANATGGFPVEQVFIWDAQPGGGNSTPHANGTGNPPQEGAQLPSDFVLDNTLKEKKHGGVSARVQIAALESTLARRESVVTLRELHAERREALVTRGEAELAGREDSVIAAEDRLKQQDEALKLKEEELLQWETELTKREADIVGELAEMRESVERLNMELNSCSCSHRAESQEAGPPDTNHLHHADGLHSDFSYTHATGNSASFFGCIALLALAPVSFPTAALAGTESDTSRALSMVFKLCSMLMIEA
mmetsp:Transcript_36551/g.79647  ORF Transcript_36551/g.79647 Transcript_36551/m.79647 type:complete len:392 (-) Transcript_36551:356-1531(-)|eukprot:CAMPEP_0118956952 /NCGR_PEP_ID=MMETSP1169-20130426/61845_1 /TAXON_ID=36882 /ORGANISM="Pyramimonas obovata, Strain CCMP722" /LENGTH=391 /DNA_ID=CAMNT_0006905003 /DNA_START=281 /DNA_END=1456 /DNA_ORIENTATION=-